MKRLILTLLASFALLPCCTSITDEMNKSNQALEERIKENADKIAALEKRCEELNFNLDALRKTVQTLQDNDFIKSVTPLYDKDGITVIGYNISLSKVERSVFSPGKMARMEKTASREIPVTMEMTDILLL